MLARNDGSLLSVSQALVTALLDLPAMMAIAGLPCNVTVRRVSPVSGFTMAWQVPYVLVVHPVCCHAKDSDMSIHWAIRMPGQCASSSACLLHACCR
jgi:hypothetical protein